MLDETMLTRRSDPGPDPDLLEPSYAESVRRYNARRSEHHRELWIRHYRQMERLHRNLAAEHQRRADALIDEEGR